MDYACTRHYPAGQVYYYDESDGKDPELTSCSKEIEKSFNEHLKNAQHSISKLQDIPKESINIEHESGREFVRIKS